jgi:hypothetical protein
MIVRYAVIIGACLSLWACSREPGPFHTARTKSMTATVQAVSQSDRHLVVLTTDGNRVMVEAPNDVTNFDTIHPGDQILLTYKEGLVAAVKRAGSAEIPEPDVNVNAGRTPAGEAPTKAIGRSIETTVRVDGVDPAAGTVTFTRSDGVTRTLSVEDEDALRFIRQLKPQDKVQVTYREAAAVSIQPQRR